MKKFLITAVMLLTLGAGCAQNSSQPVVQTPVPAPAPVPVPQKIDTTITYYISERPSTDFCNGFLYDSASYKKTVSKKMIAVVPGTLSLEDRIKTTLARAVKDSKDFEETNTRVASTTFENGIVTMYPAGGWPGSSIFMCAWQPFAEVQLEQFAEVKQIKWEPQP